MMVGTLAVTPASTQEDFSCMELERFVGVVVQGLTPNTQRIYRTKLLSLAAYLQLRSEPLNAAAVGEWLEKECKGAGVSGYNQALAAVKMMVKRALVVGVVNRREVGAVLTLRARKVRGHRAGKWLTFAEAQELVVSQDITTVEGKRNLAALALLMGCCCRREEACGVTWKDVHRGGGERGELGFLDIVNGKGSRTDTVPVPVWAQKALEGWKEEVRGQLGVEATDVEGLRKLLQVPVLLRVQNGKVVVRQMTGTGLYKIVLRILAAKGWEGKQIRPHDFRRTGAKLMDVHGAGMGQIQKMMRHSKLETTAVYLGKGMEVKLGEAAVDRMMVRTTEVIKEIPNVKKRRKRKKKAGEVGCAAPNDGSGEGVA